MKRLLFPALLGVTFSGVAQTGDSVALGAQYMNESYYSLENGEVANVNNANWDIAFDLSAYGSTIRMNRRTDILFLYPGTIADWATLDTAGHGAWDQYIDGYTDWSEGALNAPAGAAPEDLGWGEYNTITHVTEGSRLFVIKLDDDSYRKLFIEELASGVYTFKYANIDGSDEVTETITKSTYAGRNFIHYSILNEAVVDREPASADWDIVFSNWVLELAPGYFGGVTGALSNSSNQLITVAESNNVPVGDADMNANTYGSEINIIGYDWKTFNMGTFTYDIEDSLCYFIKNENDDVWKLVFTGFAGGATGKIYFTKEQVAFASAEEKELFILHMFPVPANNEVTISNQSGVIEGVKIYSMNGALVYTQGTANEGNIEIATADLENGMYLVEVVTKNNEVITKKITVNH